MTAMPVIVIDDEPKIAELVAKVARGCGFHVEEHGAAMAIKLMPLAQRVCVVLDLQMPGIDGIELMRHLASMGSKARIILISGFDHKTIESARLLGLELGLDVTATLRKPFHLAELRSVFERLRSEADADRLTVADFEAAIAGNQFALAYQPKIALQPGLSATPDRPTGFEALLRWPHPEKGSIDPGTFIPVAESLGLMDRVTGVVIDLALKRLHDWQQRGIKSTLAINISASNLDSVGFADRLADHCRAYGVACERLTIELTETAAMTDQVQAMGLLTRLRLKGFRLALDDFGTGYSSLIQLHRLPFSELKIDRAFVRDCHLSRQSRAIVKTMIDLGHNLDLTVVAEGVENPAILAALREFQCDVAQGYHIGRPMNAPQAEAWLREWPVDPGEAPAARRPAAKGSKSAPTVPPSGRGGASKE